MKRLIIAVLKTSAPQPSQINLLSKRSFNIISLNITIHLQYIQFWFLSDNSSLKLYIFSAENGDILGTGSGNYEVSACLS